MAVNQPVKITFDGSAFYKYPKLTEALRTALRGSIPGLTKELAALVRQKLQPGALFKTTTRLLPAVTVRMIENTNEIYGTVFIDPAKFPNVVAHTLESGSVAHDIEGNPYLAFFFEKLGQNVVFRKVHHPGYAGKSYMQSSLDEMHGDLVAKATDAVLAPLHEK
jgi:hypothetical protein